MISLEDDLMRKFGNSTMAKILNKTFQEGAPLDHPLLNRSIETAQKTVENQNYSIRKRLLQYDDVLNKQREIIYGIRNSVLNEESSRNTVFDLINDELDERIASLALNEDAEIQAVYKIREDVEDPEALKAIEKFVLLRALDKNWQDHLTEMEDLRRSIGLRGYGQRDPLNEYKSEAYKYFDSLMGKIRNDVCLGIFRSASSLEVLQTMIARVQQKVHAHGNQIEAAADKPAAVAPEPEKKEIKLPKIETHIELPKIGRNDMVTISKNGQTQTIKFKKAEHLIREEGWLLKEWHK